ncbi:hypothetical protein MJ588_01800 [Klebsiella pneumoniae]|nr:hypothetical protein MJ588_01800 [Klebsiella pneumoniae]
MEYNFAHFCFYGPRPVKRYLFTGSLSEALVRNQRILGLAEKVQAYVKLRVAAGMAKASPPVGSALGPAGCEHHGILSKRSTPKLNPWKKIYLIPVVITVYDDRSFTFRYQDASSSSSAEKKTAGIKSGSGKPIKDKVGKISRAQLQEIAPDQSCRHDWFRH